MPEFPVRTVFGSLFEFNDAGAEELIAEFRKAHPDPSLAPFIFYDKTTRLFACEIDRKHADQAQTIMATFQAYIDYHSRKPGDLHESPRLRPIEGVATKDRPTELEIFGTGFTKILDLDDEETDESDDENSSLGPITAYWMPEGGDVKILTKEKAEAIANLTGCFLFAEPDEKRVRLVNGDLQLALSKLQNLEPLMALAAQHRHKLKPRVDGNVIFNRGGEGKTSIKFVRPTRANGGFDRIIVDQITQPLLDQILVSEIRFSQEGSNVKASRSDVTVVEPLQSPARIGPCKVLAPIVVSSFGDSRCMNPKAQHEEVSAASTDSQTPEHVEFMNTNEALRVTEWSKNIAPEANPNIAAPEPVDDNQPISRRRVAVEDSSDEEEEEEEEEGPKVAATTINKNHDSGRSTTDLDNSSNRNLDNPVEERRQVGQPLSENDDVNRPPSPVAVDPRMREELRDNRTDLKTAIFQKSRATNNIFDVLGSDLGDQKSSSSDSPTQTMKGAESQSILIDLSSELGGTSYKNSRIGMSGANARGSNEARLNTSVSPVPDLEKHGSPRKTVKISEPARDNSRRNTARVHNDVHTEQHNNKATSMPQLVSRSMPSSRSVAADEAYENRSTRTVRQRNDYYSQPILNTLIDVSSYPVSNKPIMPPPGFEYRDSNSENSPNSELEKTFSTDASQPRVDASPRLSHSEAWSHPIFVAPQLGHPDLKPSAPMPKRNIKYLQEQAAARLRQQLEGREQHKPKSESTDRNPDQVSPERIQKFDESRSRKFHGTMRQQAPNPRKGKSKGGGGNNVKQESRKEKDARIARAKTDAYGVTVSSVVTSNTIPVTSRDDPMSAAKRQILKKNSTMQEQHPEELRKIALEAQTVDLRARLEPFFEAGRAFSGDLHFEVEFGQALIVKDVHIDEGVANSRKIADSMLNTRGQSGLPTVFTNIIANNGLDIDQVFKVKDDNSIPIWNKDCVTSSIVFEFSCQDHSGLDFSIRIDQDGRRVITRSDMVVGKIAIHCPADVWDACVVLHGSSDWLDIPEDTKQGIDEFLQLLYIPSKATNFSVYYRNPSNHSFEIRDVTVKRMSIHDCLTPGRSEFELKIMEIKNLLHSTHPNDKQLYRSYELSYDDMIDKSRIHYGLSILHKQINDAFRMNKVLELGELTEPTTTGKSLLVYARVRQIIDLTTLMVSRINWLGAHNVGTISRLHNDAQRRQALVNATLPPQALTQVNHPTPVYLDNLQTPTISPSVQHTTVPGTAAYNPTATSVVPSDNRLIPGVRARTIAGLYQQDGQYFYYGQGGAKIPVLPSDVADFQKHSVNVSSDPIEPGDSASQVGEVARLRRGFGIVGGAGRRLPARYDDRPPGFW